VYVVLMGVVVEGDPTIQTMMRQTTHLLSYAAAVSFHY
jgi:hypothetical protein